MDPQDSRFTRSRPFLSWQQRCGSSISSVEPNPSCAHEIDRFLTSRRTPVFGLTALEPIVWLGVVLQTSRTQTNVAPRAFSGVLLMQMF